VDGESFFENQAAGMTGFLVFLLTREALFARTVFPRAAAREEAFRQQRKREPEDRLWKRN